MTLSQKAPRIISPTTRRWSVWIGLASMVAASTLAVWILSGKEGTTTVKARLGAQGQGTPSQGTAKEWISKEPLPSGQVSAPPTAGASIGTLAPTAPSQTTSDVAHRLATSAVLRGFPAPKAEELPPSQGGNASARIVFQAATGATVTISREVLSSPLPLEVLTAGDPHYTDEKLPDGSELVTIARPAAPFVQLYLVRPDGTAWNLISQGLPGKRIPPPLSVADLRSLVSVLPT